MVDRLTSVLKLLNPNAEHRADPNSASADLLPHTSYHLPNPQPHKLMRDQTYSLEARLQVRVFFLQIRIYKLIRPASSKAEFCPPLDSSLIAAFISDYCPEGQVQPSSQAEQTLRTVLSQLAGQAEEECALSDQFNQLDLGTTCSVTDETSSVNDLFSNDTQITSPTAFSSNVSEASGSSGSTQPFSSPLGFLQTAFPDIPTHRLRSILGSMGDIEDLDMEDSDSDYGKDL